MCHVTKLISDFVINEYDLPNPFNILLMFSKHWYKNHTNVMIAWFNFLHLYTIFINFSFLDVFIPIYNILNIVNIRWHKI